MHAEPTKPRPVSAFRSWHNHMRADHPKLWHPIRITIVVITVWWILFCLMLAPTDNPAAIVWTIIEIAVLLLSPFFPKSMSLLFLIMSQSGPWLIPGADVNSLPGILYTFGMLAYETNNLVALLLLAYSIGDQLFRQLVLGTSNSNPVAIIAMVSLVLMLGCGLRWNQAVAGSRAEAEQAKARLREMESRNHIAEAIHDAVTGDLSAAAFVAQRRIDALSGGDDGDGSASTDGDDGKNADERRDELDKWTQVNDYILSALTNVHRVIDELDMDVTVLGRMRTARPSPTCSKPRWPAATGVYARSASTSPRSSMWRAVRQAPPRAWPESPMICFARPTPTSRVTPSPAAKPTCR